MIYFFSYGDITTALKSCFHAVFVVRVKADATAAAFPPGLLSISSLKIQVKMIIIEVQKQCTYLLMTKIIRASLSDWISDSEDRGKFFLANARCLVRMYTATRPMILAISQWVCPITRNTTSLVNMYCCNNITNVIEVYHNTLSQTQSNNRAISPAIII